MDLSLIINLNADSNVPLHRQIYTQIRRAILTGQVRSHTRLPASRQLAKALSISRTTVTQSYDQLISEGYLQTRQGAGTFVCAHIPETLLNADRNLIQGTNQHALTPSHSTKQPTESANLSQKPTLSTYGLHLHSTPERIFSQDCELSFRYGIPDLNLFPIQQWRRLLSRHQLANTKWMGYSQDPMGYGPLRSQIAQYISQVRAVRCTPEQILITHGAQQSLGIITRLLVNPGETIVFENPGYLSGRRILEANGARLIPVTVDQEGLVIEGSDGLKNRAPADTRLAYVTPSHQFPTGVLMSLSRRLTLLQWAQETNTYIIEDDYDSEFRYSGRPIPALQGLDTSERVIYIGTFSKILFPGLQIGYVVVPSNLIRLFRQAKWLCDRQCSLLNQAALADFIQTSELAKHVRRMRPIYAQRRQTLIDGLHAITEHMEHPVEVLGDQAGLHIMARLPGKNQHSVKGRGIEKRGGKKRGVEQEGDETELIKQAQAQGISLFSAGPHYWSETEHGQSSQLSAQERRASASGEFIFGFGGLDKQAIEEAIARLRPLIKNL
ncbi:MAG: PLP-dependent aminotransferase family protein [Cyanobacteria bacterium P01_F01_bin.53]